MSEVDNEPLFGKKAAFWLGGALLVGFGLLTALAAIDRRRDQALEQMDEPTAVGDPVVYTAPKPTPGAAGESKPEPTPVAVRQGIPLFAAGTDSRRDSAMLKAGTDDFGKLPLYRYRPKEGKIEETFWVKTAPGTYLKLKPGK